jgi:hypothetical protein
MDTANVMASNSRVLVILPMGGIRIRGNAFAVRVVPRTKCLNLMSSRRGGGLLSVN